ncbi:MAG: mannosyltransferase family protein [Acidimicrobiales bacterium]
MLSNRPAPDRLKTTGAGRPPGTPPLWGAVAVFLGVAAVLFLVMGAVAPHLPEASGPRLAPPFTGPEWLAGWAQWDSGWYFRIASEGYSYVAGAQSSVAFFPTYPLAVRAVAVVVEDTYLAGILVTLLAGTAVAALFFAWLRSRVSPAAAWAALAAFLLFPYAFFLYGVVYADALFVAALLGAFVLLDADRPMLAGLAGAVATAARPVGVVLVAGLAVRALERRGALAPSGGWRNLVDWRRARWADAGVLLSLAGLAAWCLYLWSRFDDPFAFASAQAAWDQGAGPETWLKFQFFEDIADLRSPGAWLLFMAHPVLTVAAACLLPRVFRRFGLGYGVFATLLVALSAVSTKNFFGMARYLLAAFPIFAVVGEELVARPALRRAALPASGAGLVALTAVFGTGYYLS